MRRICCPTCGQVLPGEQRELFDRAKAQHAKGCKCAYCRGDVVEVLDVGDDGRPHRTLRREDAERKRREEMDAAARTTARRLREEQTVRARMARETWPEKGDDEQWKNEMKKRAGLTAKSGRR